MKSRCLFIGCLNYLFGIKRILKKEKGEEKDSPVELKPALCKTVAGCQFSSHEIIIEKTPKDTEREGGREKEKRITII